MLLLQSFTGLTGCALNLGSGPRLQGVTRRTSKLRKQRIGLERIVWHIERGELFNIVEHANRQAGRSPTGP